MKKVIVAWGIALCVVTLLSGCVTRGRTAERGDVPERPSPPEYHCRKTINDITIDGILDEPDWNKAVRVPIGIRHNTDGRMTLRPMGYARILYSDDAFYAAFEIIDHDIHAAGEGHDGADTEPPNDVVLLFIDVNDDNEHFFELQLNPLNAFNDLFILRPQGKSPLNERLTYGFMSFREYNISECESAVSVQGTVNEPGDTDEGWTAEVKLPFKSLMMPGQKPSPAPGDAWRIQIAFQTGTDKGHRYHVWAPSFNEWHHHCIDHWGKAVFGK